MHHSHHYDTSDVDLWDTLWVPGADKPPIGSPGQRLSSLLSVSKWPVPPGTRELHTTPEGLKATRPPTIKASRQNDIESMHPPVSLISTYIIPTLPQDREYQQRRKRKSLMNILPKPTGQLKDSTEPTRKTKSAVLRKAPPQLASVSDPRASTSAYNIKDWLHHKQSARRSVSSPLDQPRSAPPNVQNFASAFDWDSDGENSGRRKPKRPRRHSLRHKRSFKATDVERMVMNLNAAENINQQHKSWNDEKEGLFRRTWSKVMPRIFTAKSQRSYG